MSTTFDDYRSYKREEIGKLSRIIEDLNPMRSIEIDLILRSYVVLSYAYWESCYNFFVEELEEMYFELELRQLPIKLNELVFVSLLKSSVSNYDSKDEFVTAIHFINSVEARPVKNLSSSKIEILRKSLRPQTQNPKIRTIAEILKLYGLNYKTIIKEFKDNDFLSKEFEKNIEFIIEQRNSIAHKNNGFKYNSMEFNELNACINEFISVIHHEGNILDSNDLIKLVLLEIDTFYRLLIQKIEERVVSLKRSQP